MIRLCVSIFPQVARQYAPLMLTLAVIGVIYGAAITLRQTNLKRLIAYSSISHMGFVLLGIFALSQTSLVGASLQMVSHGLITGLLFAVAGIIMQNTGEQEIPRWAGLARQMPASRYLLYSGRAGRSGAALHQRFRGRVHHLPGQFHQHRSRRGQDFCPYRAAGRAAGGGLHFVADPARILRPGVARVQRGERRK